MPEPRPARILGRLDVQSSLTGEEAVRFVAALEVTGVSPYAAAKQALMLGTESVEQAEKEARE